MCGTPAEPAPETASPAARTRTDNRAFGILMTGSSISMFGSRISAIAFPMLVLHLSGSPLIAGLVAFAAFAPGMLVYVPAGVLVDRWDPSRVMLACEVGRGISIAAVVVMLELLRHPSVYLLILAMFAEQILQIFSTLAERRYISCLVPREEASRAQARIEVRTHGVVLTGRLLGPYLFDLTPVLPFLTDAASFTASVVSLILIRRGYTTVSSPKKESKRQFRNDIAEGVRHIYGDRYARSSLALMSSTTVIAQALILIFLAEARTQNWSSFAIGAVLAASGLGGAFGSAIARLLPARAKEFWLLIQMCVWAAALGLITLSGGRSLLFFVCAMACFGGSGAIGNIELGTYLVEKCADGMIGRMSSIGQLLGIGASSLGALLGGMLVQRYGFYGAVSRIFIMVIALVGASIYVLRRVRDDRGYSTAARS
jgi:MFS family permease